MFADSTRQWDDFYVNNSDKTGIYRSDLSTVKHVIFYSAYKNIMRFYEKLFLYPLQLFENKFI